MVYNSGQIKMKKYLIVLSAIVLFAFTSCNKIMLSGNNITQEFNVPGYYTELCVENAFEVTVSDAVSQITITTDENVMPKVLVEKEGEKLKIHLKPLSVNIGSDLELKVLLPYNADLKKVNLSGASEFRSNYGLDGQKVEVELSGASAFYCNVEADEVDVQLSGSSDYYGDIAATDVDIDLTGSSDFNGDIIAAEIDMDLTGSSNIKGNMSATELDLDLEGASDAILIGEVTALKINLAGASNIVKTLEGTRYGFACDNCEGAMSGASEAYIHCDGTIRVSLSGASDLHFTGNAFTGDCTTSGGSNIIHDVLP